MADDNTRSVMRRMARMGRQESTARAMSPAKALRLSLARTADRLFDLPLTVTAVEQDQISFADLAPELGQGGMLALLYGATGESGAMRLDPGLLAALVEVQTTGHVSGHSDANRRATRTDAAIAAPMIDGTLERIDACMASDAGEAWIGGYRYGAMFEDARTLILSLSASDYTIFRVMLEIGADAHPGALTMILPRVADNDVAETTAVIETGTTKPDRALSRAVLEAPVTLRAVLGRITMPLDKLCALKATDKLPFGKYQLLEARLETGQKHLVAQARLGQMNGARAVRLMSLGRSTDTATGLQVNRRAESKGATEKPTQPAALDIASLARAAGPVPDMTPPDDGGHNTMTAATQPDRDTPLVGMTPPIAARVDVTEHLGDETTVDEAHDQPMQVQSVSNV
ncbi:FliM/FliN family flagellar motor switch protein [Roseovarius pelagicus]|uniref:FliM/FliN family flagellar motor switch protein n=1 Tax=Roseovarius pelagicus TaxID=2980108 RepID=A0ABY6DBP8_9RHOB|nr:FliM/FliN family flagellar motor switch protein [Roseovarius pelagicus]UXX82995.1 FliM/FliN family flagellar motor switch protein [Roseovarius pelagicus]